jgi:large subunit ribosomal protein L24
MKKQIRNHLKIGDKVKVLTGNNKGFIGKVGSVNSKDSTITIEGIIPRIKYIKDRQSGETKKLELQLAIHSSNVMLWDAAANTASRIGYKLVEGKKVRYFKKSGNLV